MGRRQRGDRDALLQSLVWTGLIVEGNVNAEHPAQMSFTDDQQLVEALCWLSQTSVVPAGVLACFHIMDDGGSHDNDTRAFLIRSQGVSWLA